MLTKRKGRNPKRVLQVTYYNNQPFGDVLITWRKMFKALKSFRLDFMKADSEGDEYDHRNYF